MKSSVKVDGVRKHRSNREQLIQFRKLQVHKKGSI